jgi:hypothetical protein
MRRTTAPPLLLILAAALLAGCSWLAVPTPTPSGGAGSQPGAGGGKPGGGGGGLVDVPPIDGALREVPDPTIVDALPTAVDHYVIGPDGRTVVVYYWGGNQGCFGLHSAAVELRDGVPVITVNQGTRPAAVGMACTMEALLKSTVLTLDAPLLIDGSGSEPAGGEPQLPALAQAVVPVAGVENPRAHALTGYLLGADGTSLTAYYVGGTDECYALAEASAVAGADGVPLVTIREGSLLNAGACDDIGVAKSVSITLDAPLLLDGSQL